MSKKSHPWSRVFLLLAAITTWGPVDVIPGEPDAHMATSSSNLTSETQIVEPSYAIRWHTIDNGGTTSSDGTFTLAGTAGQTDAASSTDSTFTVHGGFRSALGPQRIFQDGFESGDLSLWSAAVGN